MLYSIMSSIPHPSAVHNSVEHIAVVPFDAVLIIVINYLILYSRPLGKLVSADIQFLQSRIKRKFYHSNSIPFPSEGAYKLFI